MPAFPLTRAALAMLDAHATYSDSPTFPAKDARLRVAVGAAFAEETADRNRADLCAELAASPAGLAWIRDLVNRD